MKRTHAAATVSTDVREYAARLYLSLAERGVTQRSFLEASASAGYAPARATFASHVAALRAGALPFAVASAAGAAPLLDDAQRDIAAGWVLAKNDEHVDVELADYITFVEGAFHKGLSTSTASRYLNEAGFSPHKTQTKRDGFKLNTKRECEILWEWRKTHAGLFNMQRHLLASIDFCFTGHRTDMHTSFSAAGEAQPKSSRATTRYTNCIVTAVFADGQNRCPPVLFTYNPAFRRDRSPTARRLEQIAHLDARLGLCNVAPERVVYVGKFKSEERTMVAESPELLRRFFDLYPLPVETVWFSDNGNSFFPKGHSALLDLGFKTHKAYPAAVHQYLSPNDNRLHGTSKRSWRESRVDFTDDVGASILLLNHLDVDICDHGRHWWDQNMIGLTEGKVVDLVRGDRGRLSLENKQRRRTYRIWAGQDARGRQPNVSQKLQDSLDGVAWIND